MHYLTKNQLNFILLNKLSVVTLLLISRRPHLQPQDAIEEITRTPLLELIEKLRTQQVPPAYVLLAYQHKAFQADEEFNCVVEFLPATVSGLSYW